jgi:hypothetical protein
MFDNDNKKARDDLVETTLKTEWNEVNFTTFKISFYYSVVAMQVAKT